MKILESNQNIATELRGAIRELKEVIEGKKKFKSLDSLMDELCYSDNSHKIKR